MYSWFFENEENFRKGPVLICPGAGKSFMVRKKLDRIIEEYIDDFYARKTSEEGFEEKTNEQVRIRKWVDSGICTKNTLKVW